MDCVGVCGKTLDCQVNVYCSPNLRANRFANHSDEELTRERKLFLSIAAPNDPDHPSADNSVWRNNSKGELNHEFIKE